MLQTLSLEQELKNLREENEKLTLENQQLKYRLQKYESEEDEYCDVSGVRLEQKTR